MLIPELIDKGKDLKLLWTNNIFYSKDHNGNPLPFINCIFEKNFKQTVFAKINASYIPDLMPGTVWEDGKCVGRFDKKYSLSFNPPTTKYKPVELEDRLDIRGYFHSYISNKTFFYIPSNDFELLIGDRIIDDYKGLIIPRSSISTYYFINTDNILHHLLASPGKNFNAYDEKRSLDLYNSLNKKCIFLNSRTPIEDAIFWCRTLYDHNFQSCLNSMKSDYYLETAKARELKIFPNASLESDFPFTTPHVINAYCRELNKEYLLLDTITYHENEWKDYNDYKYFQEAKGQTDKKTDFNELDKTGNNHTKNYKLGTNIIPEDNEGYDSTLRKQRNHVKFGERESPVPKGERLEKTEQKGYSTNSFENIGEVNTTTVNPNPQSGSNIPKKDILTSDNIEPTKTKEGPNAIEKIIAIKNYLELRNNCTCKFIAPYKDPHKDHPDHITVFPPMHRVHEIKDFDEFKWLSRRRVPRYAALKGRNPSYGFGVMLRGGAILEIKNERGYFYIIEIEPGGDEQREFKTYLVCIDNFKQMNEQDIETLLGLISKSNGIYRKEIFEKTIFTVDTQKFSPSLPEETFANAIMNWISLLR